MSNIEILKQELLLQKKTIENLGGQVVVANTNPSPSEITKGITTINVPDLSGSNATEADVLLGKTFYSGGSKLRVGTFVDSTFTAKCIYEYQIGESMSEDEMDFSLPTNVTYIRPYQFYDNPHHINFTFHPDITNIETYAFAETPNFTFNGFPELTKLKMLKEKCFMNTNPYGISVEQLPPMLEAIGVYSFYNSFPNGCSINIPFTVETISSGAFNTAEKRYLKKLNILEGCMLSNISLNAFTNIVFDCDLVYPQKCKTVPSYFNLNGSFNNITLHEAVKVLDKKCFGADETCPLSDVRLKTVTCLNPTPPTTFYDNSFSEQAKENGFKIYVPDSSIEAYKAKMTNFVDYIYPMSQKE